MAKMNNAKLKIIFERMMKVKVSTIATQREVDATVKTDSGAVYEFQFNEHGPLKSTIQKIN